MDRQQLMRSALVGAGLMGILVALGTGPEMGAEARGCPPGQIYRVSRRTCQWGSYGALRAGRQAPGLRYVWTPRPAPAIIPRHPTTIRPLPADPASIPLMAPRLVLGSPTYYGALPRLSFPLSPGIIFDLRDYNGAITHAR